MEAEAVGRRVLPQRTLEVLVEELAQLCQKTPWTILTPCYNEEPNVRDMHHGFALLSVPPATTGTSTFLSTTFH